MNRDIKGLITEIDRETAGCYNNEPLELSKMKHGIIDSRAGSYGQYFSTMVFTLIYTLAIAEISIYDLLKLSSEDDISLDVLKKITTVKFSSGFQPTEFLGYCALTKTHDFMQRILSMLEHVEDKGEYRKLVGAYASYITVLHWRLHIIFPWNLGSFFPQITKERAGEIISLMEKRS